MSVRVSLEDLAHGEIVGLHALFAAWQADCPHPIPDFRRCETALAADFRMITPEGVAYDRAAVILRLQQSRASRAAGFAIDILDLRPVWQGPDAILIEYVERQHLGGGGVSQRRATALLTRARSAPGGMLWRHVQETWMDSA